MGLSNGRVTINDEPTKHKLHRFCSKKIDQWIEERMKATGQPVDPAMLEGAEFNVAFTEEPGTEQVSCETEINVGGAIWRGCELSHDTQQAFMHSLKRLHPH